MVDLMIANGQFKFFGPSQVPFPRVYPVLDNLASCFKYEVKDARGKKVMVIKIYDKTLDLMGREGYSDVGSRFY
jgi:hypothetical protein